MQPIVTDREVWSLGRSQSSAQQKTAELTEMPFGLWTNQSLKKIAGKKCKICAEFARKCAKNMRNLCKAQFAQVARKLS